MKRRAPALGSPLAPALFALALLAGCQLVSGLAGVEVASTTGAGGSGGSGPVFPCSPDPSTCPEAASPCLALAPAPVAGPVTLRVSQLEILRPTGLYGAGVNDFFFAGVTLDLPRCKLAGLGTFSWLFQIDTTQGLLRAGGAKPVSDASLGYAFVDETIDAGNGPLHIAPVELPLTFAGASETFSAKGDAPLYLPFYFDADATQVVVLPLRALHVSGTLSSDHRCIGAYAPESLELSNDCLGDRDHHGYVNGGTIEAYLLLEEADTLIAGPFGQSLCVLLTGDAEQWGDGKTPVAHCARDEKGKILFPGDWCSTTNAAKGNGCSDALQLLASFAAGAVKLLP